MKNGRNDKEFYSVKSPLDPAPGDAYNMFIGEDQESPEEELGAFCDIMNKTYQSLNRLKAILDHRDPDFELVFDDFLFVGIDPDCADKIQADIRRYKLVLKLQPTERQ